MAKKAKKKPYKRKTKAVIKALARVDWRLNFLQFDAGPRECSIVSTRGDKLPRLLVGMRAVNWVARVGVPRDIVVPSAERKATLFLNKTFIEFHCSCRALLQLVAQYNFVIRCNYHLEALEQVLQEPIRRYKVIAGISDGRWNQHREFRELAARDRRYT